MNNLQTENWLRCREVVKIDWDVEKVVKIKKKNDDNVVSYFPPINHHWLCKLGIMTSLISLTNTPISENPLTGVTAVINK